MALGCAPTMSSRTSGRVRVTAAKAREAREAAAAARQARGQASVDARTIQNRRYAAAGAEKTGIPSTKTLPVDAPIKPKGPMSTSSNKLRDQATGVTQDKKQKRAAASEQEIPMEEIPISLVVMYEAGGAATTVGDEGAAPKKLLKRADQLTQVRAAHLPACFPRTLSEHV